MNLKLRNSKTKFEDEKEGDSELDLELVKFKTAKKAERKAYITVTTLLVLFIIFLGSIVVLGGEKKTSQLSAYSDRWNDLSEFHDHLSEKTDKHNRNLYEVSSILSSATMLHSIENPQDCLYLAIGIERKYSTDEAEAVMDFVWEGGTAIIADDFGYGNTISNTVLGGQDSFNVAFLGKKLWDENYLKNSRFIKINVNRDQSRLDFEGVILLNDPTALDPQTTQESWQGRTLVTSSDKGWVDIDGDGFPSPTVPGEDMGKKPIIQEVTMGYGKAIFISDPSIFINDMWNRENNSEFVDALVRYLIPNFDDESNLRNKTKYVIFDESLHIQKDIFSNARQTFFQGIVTFTTDTQLKILIGILLLLILGVVIIIIENPPNLRHRFNLDYYNLNQLIKNDITSNDCDRIRYIYLERLRISHGMSIEEFKDLSYDQLEDMINDPELVEFALDWKKKYYGQDLEKLLLLIRDTE